MCATACRKRRLKSKSVVLITIREQGGDMKRCYFAVLFLLLGATNIFAQTDPAWGTLVESALVVGAFQFQTLDGTGVATVATTGDRYLTAPGSLVASINLPKGALITGIEVQGCNSIALFGMSYYLYRTATAQAKELITSGFIPASSNCGTFPRGN